MKNIIIGLISATVALTSVGAMANSEDGVTAAVLYNDGAPANMYSTGQTSGQHSDLYITALDNGSTVKSQDQDTNYNAYPASAKFGFNIDSGTAYSFSTNLDLTVEKDGTQTITAEADSQCMPSLSNEDAKTPTVIVSNGGTYTLYCDYKS